MKHCTLCELPADTPVSEADVTGEFCCRGCLEVYRALGETVPEESVSSTLSNNSSSEIPESAETTYLAVDGMHCSTCEVYLESAARSNTGVYDAEASYAAETVKLVYDPETTTPDELVDAVSVTGYHARRRGEKADESGDIVSRLLVGGLFGMMAMTYYILFLYPTYFGYDPVVEFGQFDGLYLAGQLGVMTAIVILYTGRPMLRGAYVSVRTGTPNVDLLVTIAALAAFFYSTGRLFLGGTDLYYDVSIVVVLAVTVGTYYEQRIKRNTAGLLSDLTELQVEQATRETGERVSVTDIVPDERLRVSPGERVPVDGTVREGTAAVDEALVTGESIPVTKRPGDIVRGGTVVTDAPLLIEAGPDGESTLDRVVDVLWDIQATRPGAQRVADKLATVFVPLVLILAGVISAWLLVTGAAPRVAVLTGLTVLIVSCPCALGLATPLAVASGLQSATNRGIVITTPALFEHGGSIDTLVLDKTGTITDGEMTVSEVVAPETAETELLYKAGALEQFSSHPVARAVTDAVSKDEAVSTMIENADVDVESVESLTQGLSGTVDGEEVLLGHRNLFDERKWTVPERLFEKETAVHQRGEVPVFVGWGERACGLMSIGDSPRKHWESVVEALGEQCRIVVLTGDDSGAVSEYRDHPAVDDVFAGVPPEGKAQAVQRLHGTVAMVGDGSNDAPALATADVGIALDSGTKLATDAADAVVLNSDIREVPTVFRVASRTNRRIRENLVWAFLYNGIAIPLALAGLLNPLFAALAMASSSLVVVANSARSPIDGTNTATDFQRSETEQTDTTSQNGSSKQIDTTTQDGSSKQIDTTTQDGSSTSTDYGTH